MRQFTAWSTGFLVLVASGCSSLQPVLTPAPYIAQQSPQRIYLVQADGARVVLDGPTVRGDSLSGLYAGTLTPASIPMETVIEVRARRANPGRTALFVGALATTVGVVAYLATRPDFDPNRPPPPFYCEPMCTGYRIGR